MIVRSWSACASEAGASSYLTHFRERVLPALRRVEGHRGAMVLRRAGAGDVELIVLTLWDSLDAIRGFSGADLTAAVVEPEARAVLSAFDTRAIHFDLVLARVYRVTVGQGEVRTWNS